MLQSHVIEIDGVFVGAAVRQWNGYRFVAVDPRLSLLGGLVLPTLAEIRSQVRSAYFGGRAPVVSPVLAEQPRPG